jgi:hypothetical protein
MATAKQIEASKLNGARSRGPKTPRSKAVSSRNAVKHGLTATHAAVLTGESKEHFDAMLEDYRRQFAPRNLMERDLVHQMAMAMWQQMRAWKTETASLQVEMVRSEDDLRKEFGEFDDNVRLAAAVSRISGTLALLHRYQTAHMRAYHRAMQALLTLRKNDVFKGNPRRYQSHEDIWADAVAESERRKAEEESRVALECPEIFQTNLTTGNSNGFRNLEPEPASASRLIDC